MGGTPTTVNEAATIANDVEKAIICDVAGIAIYAALTEQVPFFALPVISTLTKSAINWVLKQLYIVTGTATTFAIIQVQTNIETGHVNNASVALRAAIASKDPNAINQAAANFKTAFGNLIHWDGSATA